MKMLYLFLAMSVSATAFAKDETTMAHAQALHDDKCVSCHDTNVYTRENRRVQSLQELSGQVEFCMKGAAKADWSKAETASVVEYLNQKFYKF
ncbi:MAG: hypothetical protein EP315_08910 [Gammaproteobacteria bacterium]|nr:MAG: hypothetical protein EP315_08910 [Gammaproteobacteria bacterium]